MTTGATSDPWHILYLCQLALVIVVGIGLAIPKFGHRIGIRRQDPSRAPYWRAGLFAGIVLTALSLVALIAANSMKHAVGKWQVELALSAMLCLSAFVAIKSMRELRRLRNTNA